MMERTMSGKIVQKPLVTTPEGVVIQQRITRIGPDGARYEKSRAVWRGTMRGIVIKRA